MEKIPCRPVTFGGSIEQGRPYSNFKVAIMSNYKGEYFKDKENLTVEVALYLESTRIREGRNDLDNFLKPIIDALQDANVLKEQYINKIIIERFSVGNDSEEGVGINVFKYEKNE